MRDADEPWRTPREHRGGHTFANVFVLVGLVAMLVGAVLFIAARDPYVREIPPGETVVVFRYGVPAWDPWPRHLDATLSGPANATLVAEEQTGTAKGETMTEFVPGQVPDWEVQALRGEVWTLTVTNHDNETLWVSGMTEARSFEYVGGAFVGVGVLGFVSYRLGMRRSG